jgi:hypothetical protein
MELKSPGRVAGKFGDRLGSEIAGSTLFPGSATVYACSKNLVMKVLNRCKWGISILIVALCRVINSCVVNFRNWVVLRNVGYGLCSCPFSP